MPYVKFGRVGLRKSHWRCLQSWISYISVREGLCRESCGRWELVWPVSRALYFRLFQTSSESLFFLVSRHIPICRWSQSICLCAPVEFGTKDSKRLSRNLDWSCLIFNQSINHFQNTKNSFVFRRVPTYVLRLKVLMQHDTMFPKWPYSIEVYSVR